MNQNFLDFMRDYEHQKLAVAVSGGVDSVCLLCWLARMGLDVVCLHVNHGLRKNAEVETQYVCDLCDKLGISLELNSEKDIGTEVRIVFPKSSFINEALK